MTQAKPLRALTMAGLALAGAAATGCVVADASAVCTTPPPKADPTTLCSFSTSIVLHFDAAFTAPEQGDLERAMATWADATGGKASFVRGADAPHHLAAGGGLGRPPPVDPSSFTVVRVSSAGDNGLLQSLDATSGGYPIKGYTADARVYLAVDRLDPPPLLRQVAAHELGHVLGLQHVPDTDALMYPTSADVNPCLRADPRPTAADIDQLDALRCKK